MRRLHSPIVLQGQTLFSSTLYLANHGFLPFPGSLVSAHPKVAKFVSATTVYVKTELFHLFYYQIVKEHFVIQDLRFHQPT